MVDVALARERQGSPPEVVGDLVVKVLTTSRPRARYIVGKDSRLLAALSRLLPVRVLDAMRRKVFHLPAVGSRSSRAWMPDSTCIASLASATAKRM